MIERKEVIEFEGKKVSVMGIDVAPGDNASDFRVIKRNWSEISLLDETQGKLRILVVVLSLETSVCDREIHRFNKEAAALGNDVAIAVISMDLPFTSEHWCGAAGIDKVMVVSDYKYAEFGEKYACLMVEPRLLRRAVFIIDKHNIIRYAKYMPELANEPDYEEVLQHAKDILKE